MKATLFKEYTKITEQRFSFIIISLKGLGQIMLQESFFTGLFFLAGVFYGSATMGFAMLLSVCCGTLTAQLLRYDKTEIAKGIYGFSAALVGVALTFYFEPVLMVWLAIIAGSVIATILQHWFSVKNIPVFTFPFILVTWGLMYLLQHVYPVAPSAFLNIPILINQDFAFGLRGFGQVIFQGSLFAGAAFFIGVFINSPIHALYGFVAAVVAGFLSALYNVPKEGIAMGLFSYNAVLCAIVFTGNRIKDGIWTFVAVALSIVVSLIMDTYKLTPLTFPFVAGTCMTLGLQNIITRFSPSIQNKPN